ncbi:universal stress protein [Thauera sinica]|uniref:Universal stress protein n=1 Tax=Thauera sinica TaxID=2665146 RepID=A0ABW1AQ52_9RHOO|nr:universal stress protein [Thauera sp. K11]ATE61551.1 universal stress protein [Thauera sp. K11]
MMKILIPVDGSDNAGRAVLQALEMREQAPDLDIHLLSVQIPIDGHASSFVSAEALADYHREEGLAALAGARRTLEAAGAPYAHHIAVGHVADTIVRYAQEHGFDLILMGSHGRTGLLHLLMGSVAREVSSRSKVPVTLVKPAPPRA